MRVISNNKKWLPLLLLPLLSPPGTLSAATILYENFDFCRIPDNWTVQDLLETESDTCGRQWGINEVLEDNNTKFNDDSCFVRAINDGCGQATRMDTVLVTPSFDCTDVSGTSLSFQYDAYEQFGTSAFAVEVSTNGGSNWVAVWQRTQSDRGPKTATVNISTYADGASSVLIRFRYTASYDWWWQIDDVTVSADEKEKFNWLLFLPPITAGSRSAL